MRKPSSCRVKELLELANFNPGICMCSLHNGETCSVCTRTDTQREQERLSRKRALQELGRLGVKLVRKRNRFWFDNKYTYELAR